MRLWNASGKPTEEKNAPQDDFEKAALKQWKGERSWGQEEIQNDDKRALRVATPLPVVLEKCVMCHDHFRAPIGALSYPSAFRDGVFETTLPRVVGSGPVHFQRLGCRER